MTTALLQVQDLWASFDNIDILRGLNMQVNTGELHLILGMNGSGKSTFGKVLLGHPAYQYKKGNIIFEEEDISTLSTYERAQKGIFLSHQSPPAVEGVSGKDFLRAADKSMGNKTPLLAFKKKLSQTLVDHGLSRSFLDRHMNVGASGGERKKMEITSLLMLGAKLAFLDEIDSGVDIDALKTICEGINEFLSSGRHSVILVSHSPHILNYIKPTHVHVFCGGHIAASGGEDLAKTVYEKGYKNFLDCEYCHSLSR